MNGKNKTNKRTIGRFFSLALAAVIILSSCVFAVPCAVSAAEGPDAFDNGYIRGSYYCEGETVHYSIERLTDIGGELYAALYDKDGNLAALKVGEPAGSFEGLSGGGYRFKAFVWDEDQSPLCEPLDFGVAVGDLPTVTGTIVANKISDYSGEAYSNAVKVKVSAYTGNDGAYTVGETYELEDPSDLAGGYLGYSVTMNVTNGAVAAAAPSAENKVERFALDRFVGREDSVIRFTDQRSIDAGGVPVIYNGIGGYDLNRVFEPVEPDGGSHIVEKGCLYGGSVTAVSNDGDNKTDVLLVRLEESGVVDAVSEMGLLAFKNAVGSREHDNNGVINFSDGSAVIKVLKGGKPYDRASLKENDVVSVTANTAGSRKIYYIEVKPAEEAEKFVYIESKEPSDLSADGGRYTTDSGEVYYTAPGAWADERLDAGDRAVLYIDKFGRIAGYVKDTSKNYAYILNADIAPASFGESIPVLQILYMDGTVAVIQFDRTIAVYNPTLAFGSDYTDHTAYSYSDHDNVKEALDSIVGRVVDLDVEAGLLKSITLPCEDNREFADSTLSILGGPSDYSYSRYSGDMKLGNRRIGIDENTLVFFVGRPGSGFEHGKAAEPFQMEYGPVKPEYGEIVKGSELRSVIGSNDSKAVAYTYANESGIADVVVVYNAENVDDPSITPPPEQ